MLNKGTLSSLCFTGNGARRHLTIYMRYHALLKEVYCRYIKHLDMIYTINNNQYIYSLFTGCSFKMILYITWAFCVLLVLPSVLWCCWLGGRKGIRPVKNWVMGCWLGYLLGRGADLHMAQLMPLPLTVSCFSKIQIGFTVLVPAHLGNPGQSPEGHKTDVCYWLLF